MTGPLPAASHIPLQRVFSNGGEVGSALLQPAALWLYAGPASPFVPPTSVLSPSWPLGLEDESLPQLAEGPSSLKNFVTG